MSQKPSLIRIDWNDIKARAREVGSYLPHFLRSPVESIKRVPSWDWTTIIILQILIGMFTGVLGAFVSHTFLSRFVSGLIVSPVMDVLTSFFWSVVLYYAFIFLERTQLEFRKIYIIVVLAFIPTYAFGVFSNVFKPVIILGVIGTGVLLTVGFTENFLVDGKKTGRMMSVVAAVVCFVILWGYYEERTSDKYRVPDNYTPESLEQIHKEMSK